QPAGVVRETIALTGSSHLYGDLRIAVGRQIGKEVVLDLMAEVACEHVEDRPAADVGGAERLPEVPATACLIARLSLAEHLDIRGEMPAEDDRERPDVPNEIGERVPEQHREKH